MSARDVQQELNTLISELGVPEDEAYEALGLSRDGPEPLVSGRDGDETPVLGLAEMFPHVPIPIIEEAFESAGGDIDKSSEQLLSWEAVQREEQDVNDPSNRGRLTKQQKQQRKIHKKMQRKVEHEESEIAVLSASLNVPMEEARALYWTHENDITAAVVAKTPYKSFASVNSGTGSAISASESKGVEAARKYSQLSHRELRRQISDTKLRIQTLATKARPSSNAYWERLRAQDSAAELRSWQSELRALELALFKSEKLRASTARNAIDLHGCTLDQAKVIVSEATHAFLRGSESKLEIITGAGRHSAGGHSVLKAWVRNYLKKENMKNSELDGSFVVYQRLRV